MHEEPTPAPGPLSDVDLTFLDALRLWGAESAGALLDCFPAARRASLWWGLKQGPPPGRAPARDFLRKAHAAQARPDLTRIDVTWWVRALRDEPPSVVRTVADGLPVALGDALKSALNLPPDEPGPARPPSPEAARRVLALWSSLFVGDLPERADDPPVIAALTRFDGPTVVRLIRTTGLAKWALTPRPLPDLDAADRERLGPLRASLAGIDSRFLQIAERDVNEIDETGPRAFARAGLVTVARLLNAAEPYRVRWTLQHLPYSTAKAVRNQMGPAGRRTPMLARWEGEVLRAAWCRLRNEGRIVDAWEAAP